MAVVAAVIACLGSSVMCFHAARSDTPTTFDWFFVPPGYEKRRKFWLKFNGALFIIVALIFVIFSL